MRSLILVASVCLAFGPGIAAANASSSDWHDSEGGKVRIVTTGKPDAQGKLQGALEIALKPGWKTYWRDPGDSGVPPQIDVTGSSNLSAAILSYPAPQRHDDGYSKWAGYDYPVALPIEFTITSPDDPVQIEANVLIGICETICIPLQTKLTVDPNISADDTADATVVRKAQVALPAIPRPGFGVDLSSVNQEKLIVEATVPGDGAATDFFIAGEQGYMFGTPVKTVVAGKAVFTIPIIDRPAETPSGEGLFYTLTDASASVSGTLPYPH